MPGSAQIKRLEGHAQARTCRGIINDRRCTWWNTQRAAAENASIRMARGAFIGVFAPETRSERQRTSRNVESLQRVFTSFAFVLADEDDDENDVELTDEGSFVKVDATPCARENIAGYPSWTLIKRGLRGSSSSRYGLSRWVTQGSTAPGGAPAGSSVIRRGLRYGAAQRHAHGRCFRNSPLICLRAPPLSSRCRLQIARVPACVRSYKRRGQARARARAIRCHR